MNNLINKLPKLINFKLYISKNNSTLNYYSEMKIAFDKIQ